VRGKVWFQINWQTGASSEHEIIRHAVSYREHSDGERVQERVRQLHANQQTDRQIATVLHAEGYRTTYGQPFQAKHIWYLRGQWGLVQVPIKGGWKSCGFGHRVFTLGHHFRHGFGGPPKWMGMLIPFGDKSQQAFRKMFLIRKIGDL